MTHSESHKNGPRSNYWPTAAHQLWWHHLLKSNDTATNYCTNLCGMIRLVELNITWPTWFVFINLYFHSTNDIMPRQFVQNKFVQEFVAISLFFAKLSLMRILLQNFLLLIRVRHFYIAPGVRNMKILCSNSWYFVGETMLNNSNSLPMVCFSLSTTISRRIYSLCEQFIWDIY